MTTIGNETIITFHGLGEPPAGASAGERRVWVPAAWLEALVAAAPPQGLSFAFDDGNASDTELALPILTKHGLSARFFILAGRIGRPGYLDGEDLGRLRDAAMRIGSHGLNHCDWRLAGAQELRAETVDARSALAEVIGEPITEAACPFGSYDRRVLRALRDAGFERVFTGDGAPGRAGAKVMPRVSISRERPLEYWVALAAGAGTAGVGRVTRAKRLLKRLR